MNRSFASVDHRHVRALGVQTLFAEERWTGGPPASGNAST
jgi:hypothetical protein